MIATVIQEPNEEIIKTSIYRDCMGKTIHEILQNSGIPIQEIILDPEDPLSAIILAPEGFAPTIYEKNQTLNEDWERIKNALETNNDNFRLAHRVLLLLSQFNS